LQIIFEQLEQEIKERIHVIFRFGTIKIIFFSLSTTSRVRWRFRRGAAPRWTTTASCHRRSWSWLACRLRTPCRCRTGVDVIKLLLFDTDQEAPKW